MPRSIRLHAPGSAFHITARTQNKTHWFTPELRDSIAGFICEAGATSGNAIFAFVVMANHLHIIVRQGLYPLGWMMQRILQRTSILVRKSFPEIDGHVFGRAYWSGLCDDADYLRQAIIYTHLNAFYAGMCEHPDDYRWHSHADYTGAKSNVPWCLSSPGAGLPMFSQMDVHTPHADYARFIDYWMKRKRLPLGVKYICPEDEWEACPKAPSGDAVWKATFTAASVSGAYIRPTDIRDRAVSILGRLAPDVSLNQLRTGVLVKKMAPVRHELIATLDASGFRGVAIARCLNVSPALVSQVRANVRSALLDKSGKLLG